MKIYKGSEEYALKTLADAVKTLDMTDKQILAASRPKPSYYTNMTMWDRRTCLWCPWATNGKYGTFYTATHETIEPICQLEIHYMEKHHGHD